MIRTILALLLCGLPATAGTGAPAAPASSPQSSPQPPVRGWARQGDAPARIVGPRIEIAVSPDGRTLVMKIVMSGKDVTLHAARPPRPNDGAGSGFPVLVGSRPTGQ